MIQGTVESNDLMCTSVDWRGSTSNAFKGCEVRSVCHSRVKVLNFVIYVLYHLIISRCVMYNSKEKITVIIQIALSEEKC